MSYTRWQPMSLAEIGEHVQKSRTFTDWQTQVAYMLTVQHSEQMRYEAWEKANKAGHPRHSGSRKRKLRKRR